tara:strand:+ start:115 stop:543 length:429 start_codon:yes stop_codon:yes gene_type:complete
MKIIKTIFITLILLFSMVRLAWCGGDDEVSVTIAALQQTYFNAVQSQDFATAYDMVTENMRDGRTKEKYVEDWEGVMKSAQVDLIEGGVTAIDVNGEKARVHAWTKASDVFNVIPIIEKEIDHWVLVNDVWKLDLTEVLMDD